MHIAIKSFRFLCLEPVGVTSVKSVSDTHGECDARYTVALPAAESSSSSVDRCQIILLGDSYKAYEQLTRGRSLPSRAPTRSRICHHLIASSMPHL